MWHHEKDLLFWKWDYNVCWRPEAPPLPLSPAQVNKSPQLRNITIPTVKLRVVLLQTCQCPATSSSAGGWGYSAGLTRWHTARRSSSWLGTPVESTHRWIRSFACTHTHTHTHCKWEHLWVWVWLVLSYSGGLRRWIMYTAKEVCPKRNLGWA